MLTPEGLMSFVTLAALEIVLGIDNVIFISIAASRLPRHRQLLARQIGLSLALILRVILLSTLVWLAGLTTPLFAIGPLDFSARDLILIGGGAYLLWKAGQETGEMLRPAAHPGALKGEDATAKPDLFLMVVAQIAVIDVIFAIDSIVTAVGMTNELPIMVAAVVVAIVVMMFASGVLSDFIEKNPSTKMLALVFLLVVGLVLVVEGFGVHVSKAYLYAALGFAVLVETLNVLARRAEAVAQSVPDAVGEAPGTPHSAVDQNSGS
jgi:predicted tellurium resistance membrane protein TerC